MPVAEMTSRAAVLPNPGERAHQPFWMRTFILDGLLARRFAFVLLSAGALLAWTPIHPGLLCPLRATTGVPCPTCGMTTSVRACLNLDLGAALAANPAGLGSLLLAAGLVTFRPRRIVVPWVAFGAVLASMWIWQLFRFSIL